MQLDDSKHKVYIYNLEDELSSESESEDAKLVFLPDIEKHLRDTRLRLHAPMLPSTDGELAEKQLVLYSVPSSLSVPEEHDSVRKAIIEARARARSRTQACAPNEGATVAGQTEPGSLNRTTLPPANVILDAMPEGIGVVNATIPSYPSGNDPDFMDID